VCSIRFASDFQKTSEKKKHHLIFMNFGVMNFIMKKSNKNIFFKLKNVDV
jgi:hypothetical protein